MLKSLQGRLTLLFVAFVLLVVVSISAMMWGVNPHAGNTGSNETGVDTTLNHPTQY